MHIFIFLRPGGYIRAVFTAVMFDIVDVCDMSRGMQLNVLTVLPKIHSDIFYYVARRVTLCTVVTIFILSKH